jgi:hypothetical protein
MAAIRPQGVAAARRLAVVVGYSPVRSQARRVVKREEADLFVSVAEAEAWLLGGRCRRE